MFLLSVSLSYADADFFNYPDNVLLITAGPNDEHVNFEAEINNPTANVLYITELGTTCGCSSIKISSHKLLTDQHAVLSGLIKIDRGQTEKNIIVTVTGYYSGANPEGVKPINVPMSEKLTVKLTVKQIVSITPRILLWRSGREATPKSITAKILDAGSSFNKKQLTATSENLFDIEFIENTNEFISLKVTPKSTEKPLRDRFAIRYIDVNKVEQVTHVELLIRN